MIRLVTLAAVFILFMSAGQAQTNIIKGFVRDEIDTSPVRGASVSLLLQADSSMVKSTLTDSLGFFQFTDVALDSFIVTVENVEGISAIEYELSYLSKDDVPRGAPGQLDLNK